MLHGKATGLGEMSAVQTVARAKHEKSCHELSILPEQNDSPKFMHPGPAPFVLRSPFAECVHGTTHVVSRKLSKMVGPLNFRQSQLSVRSSQIESPKMVARGGVPRGKGRTAFAGFSWRVAQIGWGANLRQNCSASQESQAAQESF